MCPCLDRTRTPPLRCADDVRFNASLKQEIAGEKMMKLVYMKKRYLEEELMLSISAVRLKAIFNGNTMLPWVCEGIPETKSE